MSYKLEDLLAKTNKMAGEAVSENRTAGEHREDGGDKNNQSTATTTSTNHHQWERFNRGCLLHLSRKYRFNYRRNGRRCQSQNWKGKVQLHQLENQFGNLPHSEQGTRFAFSTPM
ncbi:unnamed protein product [Trichobilharzia szidati]|nr:unnamed protein product [Trichobilharzia szidati]